MMRFLDVSKLAALAAVTAGIALGCGGPAKGAQTPAGGEGGASAAVSGGSALADMPGAKLFARRCQGCHTGGDRRGPAIGVGYNSRAWIRGFLQDPSGGAYYGPTGIDEMKPVAETGADLDALVEFVYSQSGAADADAALAATGSALFADGSCSDCHAADGTTEGEVGPNLGGRGTIDWFVAFVADPGNPRWFGDKNEMPKFGKKLSDDERRQIGEYLVALRDAGT